MTYYCEDCGFVFYGAGDIKECPYCGMHRINASSREEINQIRTFSGQQESDYNFKEAQ